MLFGSLARGCIHKTSDIDLLVVMKHAKDRLLLDVEDSEIVSERRRIYEDHGVYLTISPYVLSTEEAKRHRPVYLDLVAEGEVLLDREGFMAGVFDEMRSRMKEMGTKRVFLPDGSWYWVLKPDLKFGEEVEI